MWVLDHLDDLESDFSVFHRVEDIHSLDGPRFFRFALRIFAYDGVMSARLAELEADNTPSTAPTGPIPEGGRNTRDSVDLSAMSATNPGWFERTVTSRG